VGFEVLYWIPFLRWLAAELDLPQEGLTALSRGGVAAWYAEVCHHYREIFAYVSADEFRLRNEQRWEETGAQKHLGFDDWDRELVQRSGVGPLDGFTVLHPKVMYDRFRDVWRDVAPVSEVLRHAVYRRWLPPDRSLLPPAVPDRYVAVKFYDRPSFPDTPENRGWVAALLEKLAGRVTVVSLGSSLNVDDHPDFDPVLGERIVPVLEGVPATENLLVQSAVIAHADAFVGTYGGLSYVAQAYGVPAVALASDQTQFVPAHLNVALAAAERYATPFAVVHPRTASLAASLLDLVNA
jgi:hypothetical protein